jgi:hypothetical protein
LIESDGGYIEDQGEKDGAKYVVLLQDLAVPAVDKYESVKFRVRG